MSRFRRLTLDEARQTFPLINEEARKALKGGCDTCENWKIENPGIVIYSVDEWEQMSKNGNWTVGAVCGEGLMVGPNTVVYGSTRPPLCAIHPHFYGKNECLYCYFDGFQHCGEHKVYFPFTKDCLQCYYEQNYYEQTNYNTQTGNTTGEGRSEENPNTVVNGNKQPGRVDFSDGGSFNDFINWFKLLGQTDGHSSSNPIKLSDIITKEDAIANHFNVNSGGPAGATLRRTYGEGVNAVEILIADSTYGSNPNENKLEYNNIYTLGTSEQTTSLPPYYIRLYNNNKHTVISLNFYNNKENYKKICNIIFK